MKRNPNERNERPSNEHYRHNQRLKVLIIEVRDPNSDAPKMRGEQARPAIVVSRTHPDLIRRLFEIEVPEIYDGMVEIKSIAREPGARSKIAVASREANLDPVGACVGPKGSRVRMVVEELRNERVDVIQSAEDPAVYVANALSPAKVTRVVIDEDNHYATVVVPDDQLSLAIGKEGQNARLAARLTGWHIDIKSASFTGESLAPMDNMLIDEDEAADDEAGLCAYVARTGCAAATMPVRAAAIAACTPTSTKHKARVARGAARNDDDEDGAPAQLHRMREAGRQGRAHAHRARPVRRRVVRQDRPCAGQGGVRLLRGVLRRRMQEEKLDRALKATLGSDEYDRIAADVASAAREARQK